MDKRKLITSPIIISGVAFIGIKYYMQTKKLNIKKQTIRTNLKDMKRVVILGDSVARGYGARNGGLTPHLKKFFEAEYGEVEIINKGVDNLTSKGLLNNMEKNQEVRSAVSSANIVLINVGGNDLIKRFRIGGSKALVLNIFRIRRSYNRNLEAIIEHIKELNPYAAIIVNSLYNSLDDNYQYFGFTKILFTLWNRSIKQDSIIKVNTKGLSRDKDIWVDMVHPNDAGYEELAKIIIQQLKPFLLDENKQPAEENVEPLLIHNKVTHE
jgi:lysophospholipase L1-like esterase